MYGRVELIDTEYNTIHIYIAPAEDHHVFAPRSGILQYTALNGSFRRHEKALVFSETDKPHNAELQCAIEDVEFQIQVGSPDAHVDRIQVYPANGTAVVKGTMFAQILVGSRARVQVPRSYRIQVECGAVVRGGRTVIASS